MPEKKPITYKKKSKKQADKSEVLSKKDYEYAKQIFFFNKQKKWTAALKEQVKS